MSSHTEFGPRKGQLLRGVLLLFVGFGCAAALISLAAAGFVSIVAVAIFGPVGVFLAVGGIAIIWAWAPLYHLALTEEGIDLTQRRRHAIIPWSDIGHWWIGVPPTFWGRQSGQPALLVRPADHVQRPDRLPWKRTWSAAHHVWHIADPAQLDADADTLAGAMRTHAADREGAPPMAGTIGDGVRAEFHRSPRLLADAIAYAVLGLAFLVATGWVATAVPPLPATIFGVVFAAHGLVLVVLAARSWLVWRANPRLSIDEIAITVGDTRGVTVVPWSDIAAWRLWTASRWSRFPQRLFSSTPRRSLVSAQTTAGGTLLTGAIPHLDGSADDVARALRVAAPDRELDPALTRYLPR